MANSLMAIVGDVFGPAVAAMTLGLYAREQLARRMGRNSAFDHAGNVAIAVVAGAVGYAFSQRTVFLLVPVFATLAGIAVLSIPALAANLRRLEAEQEARGGSQCAEPEVAKYKVCRRRRLWLANVWLRAVAPLHNRATARRSRLAHLTHHRGGPGPSVAGLRTAGHRQESRQTHAQGCRHA